GNELAHWWIVRVKAIPVVKGSNFLGLAHTWQRSRRGDAGEAKRQSLTPVPILALEFFGGDHSLIFEFARVFFDVGVEHGLKSVDDLRGADQQACRYLLPINVVVVQRWTSLGK